MRGRFTYANVMSTIAVFVAVGLGGAYAADKITSKDIAKNAVKSKAIKDRTIKGKDVKDGTLKQADLTPLKVVHPVLSNGNENDCLWIDGVGEAPGTNQVNYRRNGFGEVTLGGFAESVDGPGGDAACDSAGAEAVEDGTVFTLNPEDRPAKTSIILQPGGTTGVLVVGNNGAITASVSYPPGAVVSATGVGIILDGISFVAADAAPTAAPASGEPDRISPKQLRAVLGG